MHRKVAEKASIVIVICAEEGTVSGTTNKKLMGEEPR